MVHSNWNCPQCHRPNISGDLIQCPSCGKKRNRWGYWDCRYCGTKEIRGDHKECPNCGKARDRDVKFYLNDDSPYEFVDEVSGESAVRIGRQNWICPYCSQQNDDSVQTCSYCGASRAESIERYHDIPNPNGSVPPNSFRNTGSLKNKINKSDLFVYICVGLIFLPFILLISGYVIRNALNRIVHTSDLVSAYWQSDINIEALKSFEDSCWEDELPKDARVIRTAIESRQYIHHYEDRTEEVWVEDYNNNDDDDYGWDDDDDWDYDDGGGWDDGGWDDYGDGQFGMLQMPALMICPKPPIAAFHWETRYYQEPVYATREDTKCYYEYDKWVKARTVRQKGEGEEHPYYGELTLAENEREKNREIKYFVQINYKKTQYLQQCTEEQYYQCLEKKKVKFRAAKDGISYHISICNNP